MRVGVKMDINYCKYLTTLPLMIRPLSGYGSWRGIYAEPALFFDEDSDYVSISTLADALDDLSSGRRFEGYKGGSYWYNDCSPLHFESGYSYCSDNSISRYLSPESVAYLNGMV